MDNELQKPLSGTWCHCKGKMVGSPDDLLISCKEEICEVFCKFVMEAKNIPGKDYTRNILCDFIIRVQSLISKSTIPWNFYGKMFLSIWRTLLIIGWISYEGKQDCTLAENSTYWYVWRSLRTFWCLQKHPIFWSSFRVWTYFKPSNERCL